MYTANWIPLQWPMWANMKGICNFIKLSFFLFTFNSSIWKVWIRIRNDWKQRSSCICWARTHQISWLSREMNHLDTWGENRMHSKRWTKGVSQFMFFLPLDSASEPDKRSTWPARVSSSCGWQSDCYFICHLNVDNFWRRELIYSLL